MALGIPPEILEWLENGEAAKLCSCGEEQVLRFFYRDVLGEYSMAGNGSWLPNNGDMVTIEAECACCMTGGAVVTTQKVDKKIWVVVTNSGGLVNDDVWAYTTETGAQERQDDEDAKYGIKRNEKGEIIDCHGDEGDYIVGTYVVELDQPVEHSFMNVEGMGETSDLMAPMTNESDDLTSEQRMAAAEVGKRMVDPCTNCDAPAEFYYTNENGTFGLCQKCKDAFELGQVNPDVRVKTDLEKEATEAVLLSPDDVRDVLDFIAEAEDKGVDLKEVERVRNILGYPIP